MSVDHLAVSKRGRFAEALHATFRALPIACFPFALASDIAYAQTSNLLWLHFAEWLLFAGIVGLTLALVAVAVDLLAGYGRPGWRS